MAIPPPDEILGLARARAGARSRHDWHEADRLKAEIEAARWKVVDEGLAFSLVPARPPDVVVGGRTRYGSSASVPSRLAEPPVGLATVVLLAGDDAEELPRTVAAIEAHAPAGTWLVVVADGPDAGLDAVLPPIEERGATHQVAEPPGTSGRLPVEIVVTSERLGRAAAIDAGTRRAAAPVVVVTDTSAGPAGDVVSPLVAALADPRVAITGATGIRTADLRHLEAAPSGDAEAARIPWAAFRRADYAERGPMDERLRTDEYLDLWWSLVLRDEGEGRPPRRAVVLGGLPLAGRPAPATERDGRVEAKARATRRDYYRVLERFGRRADLLGGRGLGDRP